MAFGVDFGTTNSFGRLAVIPQGSFAERAKWKEPFDAVVRSVVPTHSVFGAPVVGHIGLRQQ